MHSSVLLYFISAFTLALVTAAPTTSDAAASPKILSYGLNGSGCPPGSTTSSTDGSSIAAVFSAFIPEVTGANPTTTRQNCQASISVSIPAGVQIALKEVKYDGFVDLASKVYATHSSYYYFQGSLSQGSGSGTINGPSSRSVDFSDSYNSTIWSTCGGNVVVNVDISVIVDNKDNRSDGFAAVDEAKFGPFITRAC